MLCMINIKSSFVKSRVENRVNLPWILSGNPSLLLNNTKAFRNGIPPVLSNGEALGDKVSFLQARLYGGYWGGEVFVAVTGQLIRLDIK